MPGGIVGLKGCLRTLDLSSNEFKRWPAELGDLLRLRSLNLAGNGITMIIGETILGLGKLEALDVSDNRLSGLPVNFAQCMPVLSALRLRGNKGMTMLPDFLEKMIMLREIAWDEPKEEEVEEEEGGDDDESSSDGDDGENDGENNDVA